MANSTHAHQTPRAVRVLAIASILALGFGWLGPSRARADGDPASDVLAAGSLFLPQDAGATVRQQAQLAALLRAAQGSGYQIRVAIIASATDLGSITELWRQPENYARFLGQELSLVYRGPLLVVMPDGFGLDGGPLASERVALAGVHAPVAAGLAATTVTAIQRLAAAAGHALAPLGSGSTSGTTTSGPVDGTAWIVFAAGCVLVALAWSASLRARPLRARTGSGP